MTLQFVLTCPCHSHGCIADTSTIDGYYGHLIDCVTLQSSVRAHQRPVGAIGRYDNGVAAVDTDIVAGWGSTHNWWCPHYGQGRLSGDSQDYVRNLSWEVCYKSDNLNDILQSKLFVYQRIYMFILQ